MSKDYYKILGVEKNASDEDIKRAYRRLAHQYHPDKPTGDEAKFKEINEAFQVVGNKEKRGRYDQFGADFEAQGGFGGGATWDDFMRAARGGGAGGGVEFNFGGIDLSDLLGDMFGFGGGTRTRTGNTRRVRRGRDIHVDAELALADILTDVKRTVRLRKPHTCELCGGTGAKPGSGTKRCATCGGTGVVQSTQRTFLGMVRTEAVCDACDGEGHFPEMKCETCNMRGVVHKDSEFQLNIPAGIEDGTVLRFAGKGEHVKKGEAGDVYVRVHVRPDPSYARDGATLHTVVHVPMTVAALGGTATVQALDGDVAVAVPAGTQPGTVLRIKERGLPEMRGKGRGALMAKVIVDVPKKLSRKAKKLLEELNGEL